MRPLSRTPKRAVAAMALLVVVGVAGAALAPLGSSDAGRSSTGETPAGLAALSRPATSEDTLPLRLQKAVEAAPGVTLREGTARRAQLSVEGTEVYLASTLDGRACLVDSNLSEVLCATAGEIATANATASDACSPVTGPNAVELAGIVPNDATKPVFVFSNGQSAPVRVEGNTFIERFMRHGPLPKTIEWSTPNGTEAAPVNLPADAATIDCSPGPANAEGSTHPPETTVEYNKG